MWINKLFIRKQHNLTPFSSHSGNRYCAVMSILWLIYLGFEREYAMCFKERNWRELAKVWHSRPASWPNMTLADLVLHNLSSVMGQTPWNNEKTSLSTLRSCLLDIWSTQHKNHDCSIPSRVSPQCAVLYLCSIMGLHS